MSLKISKVTELIPPGASGGYIRERIAMSIGSARRQVRKEKGLVSQLHSCTVKIVIEQEFDDGK